MQAALTASCGTALPLASEEVSIIYLFFFWGGGVKECGDMKFGVLLSC